MDDGRSQIRALFFDFDGTLWDSETAAFQSWRETYAEYGHEMTLDVYATMLGTISGFDPVQDLERLIGEPIDHEEVAARRWDRKMQLVRRLSPRPGVLKYITEARHLGLVVAIVSTDDMEWITTGLEILGLLDAWDFIECAEGDRLRAKPSPALYVAALERSGLQADEAIAIEDSPNGIEAAKSAGIYCVGFANEVTRLLDLSKADVVVDSLADLPLAKLLQEAGSH
jgi:HAD superfamily hydrolase (TIGR01509 family)